MDILMENTPVWDSNVSEERSILYMQVFMCHYLMERWNKTAREFVEIDKLYDILWFIREGYYPFHLMGDEGIAEEIEQFIVEQGGSWS